MGQWHWGGNGWGEADKNGNRTGKQCPWKEGKSEMEVSVGGGRGNFICVLGLMGWELINANDFGLSSPHFLI